MSLNLSVTDLVQIFFFVTLAYATLGTLSVNLAVTLFGGTAKPSIGRGIGVSMVAALVGFSGAVMLGGFGVPLYALAVVGSIAAFYKVGLARAAVIAVATVPCAVVAGTVGRWLIG